MPPSRSVVRLPDGQSYDVNPVFGGVQFQSQQLNSEHNHAFPIGWTIDLKTEDDCSPHLNGTIKGNGNSTETNSLSCPSLPPAKQQSTHHIHAWTKPTLQNDTLFISIDALNPSASPTRQAAMMLWISLYWYFHCQPSPSPFLSPTPTLALMTPDAGRPRGEWRIGIKRDGILRSRNLIPKLERMGLISSLNSAVGTDVGDDDSHGWDDMFVSRRSFWQIPGRLFLFTLQPSTSRASPSPRGPVRMATSRPISPLARDGNGSGSRTKTPPLHNRHRDGSDSDQDLVSQSPPQPNIPTGPFHSSSHLPTYYPPPPSIYTFTGDTRHPVRPKPPRMSEVFYTRFIPSVGQYLSFRVASLSKNPVPYGGPVGPRSPSADPTTAGAGAHEKLCSMSDTALLKSWLGNKRVSKFWGTYNDDFLPNALELKHSFPIIGLWDGVPFGYFEIYWVKEDILGKYAGGADDWDRGLHVLVGEEWSRGRVPYWLSSLAHWCWMADMRTMSLCLEPRVDNERFIQHLQFEGFAKEKQISFPHKQSWFIRMGRDAWDGPRI